MNLLSFSAQTRCAQAQMTSPRGRDRLAAFLPRASALSLGFPLSQTPWRLTWAPGLSPAYPNTRDKTDAFTLPPLRLTTKMSLCLQLQWHKRLLFIYFPFFPQKCAVHTVKKWNLALGSFIEALMLQLIKVSQFPYRVNCPNLVHGPALAYSNIVLHCKGCTFEMELLAHHRE